MFQGKIEVPAIFYYGMTHLRVLLRALYAQSLRFLGHTYRQGKDLGITFLVYQSPFYIFFWIFCDIFYYMIIEQCAAVSWILTHYSQVPIK